MRFMIAYDLYNWDYRTTYTSCGTAAIALIKKIATGAKTTHE
jgi:hypothetical protein